MLRLGEKFESEESAGRSPWTGSRRECLPVNNDGRLFGIRVRLEKEKTRD
jgi:hypothetical protein